MRKQYKIPKRDNLFKFCYSKISRIFTPYFSNFTANQITIISGILGIFGALLLISSSYSNLVIGAILIQLYAILDLVDGDIARIKNLQSKFGMWLDTFFDKLIDFLIILSSSIGIYLKTNDKNTLILGIFLMGVVFFNQFIMLLNDTYFSSYKNTSGKLIKSVSKNKLLILITKILKFFLKHLFLYHITFLFFISFFAILDSMHFGFYFLTINGILSLISLVLVNFVKLYKIF
jgi:phosphatidylglycerophosphate synthase